MRKWGMALGLLLVMAQAGVVSAKTLEDVLKEKGVITEEDYKEVTKVKPIDYKIGKGFTFTTADETFQLSVGARLQARYSFLDREPPQQARDVSEWRIRRMKFWMGGYAYTKDLTYLLQVDLTQTEGTASSGITPSKPSKLIEHAYLNYRLIDEAQLLVGQTKVPFGRQWLTSSGSLSFVDRSPASDFFRPGYDIGVKLHGKIAKGLVNYDLGGYGGKGQNTVSGANDNSFAARVTVNPLGDMPYSEADLDRTEKPLFSIGANYFYTRLGRAAGGAIEKNNHNFTSSGFLTDAKASSAKFTPAEKFDVHLIGFDTAFKWMGAYAIAEYLMGQAEGDISGQLLRAHGYFVQAGYCILPKKLEAAVRYSYIDPDRDVGNDLRSEIAGAVSCYFNKHNLKLQGDIANIHNQATSKSDEMQYRLQVQLIF